MTFLDFLDMISVVPEPGQLVFIKVALCGVDPIELPDDERAIARAIFGDVDRIPPEARELLCLVMGGRSGKTYLLSLVLLFIGLTIDLSGLAPGELAVCPVVAPRLEEARQSINYIRGALLADEDLQDHVIRDTTDEVAILREDGNTVTFRAVAAGVGGIGGRGKSLPAALLTETCFFRDANSGVVNDQDVYKAIGPRIMEGGLLMIESTPWTSSGLLYDFWKKNFGKPRIALAAQADTRVMRSNARILAMVAREYERDPENAKIEFGAEWGSTDAVRFVTDADMDALFVDEPERTAPQPGDTIAAAADLGFTRNSSTLCVLAEEAGVLRPLRLIERKPEPGKPLVPSEVCEAFALELVACRCRVVATDQHYRETFREHVGKMGVSLYDGGDPDERFVALRTAIRSGKVKVPTSAPYAARLRRQLERVKARQLSGGRLSITLPSDLDGSHGDAADVLARAVWARQRYGGTAIPKAVDPVRDEEARLIKALEKRVRADKNAPWWKKKRGQG